MPARLKLIVAYDGEPFAGWQSQASGQGIQDRVEAAFQLICSQPVRVHGAGRTDAGVHALAQCAHVDLPARRYSTERWVSALNSAPSRIAMLEIHSQTRKMITVASDLLKSLGIAGGMLIFGLGMLGGGANGRG